MIPRLRAVTKPWFEITVPLATLGFTTTSKLMLATLARLLDGSAGIEPGVGSAREWSRLPFTSGDTPAPSPPAAPARGGLPAPQAVFTGTPARTDTVTP